ncbi:class A beta-lactamase-related serine hydrolase [Hymenobacter sp. J193]|uniref:class A beta-lactamase-related serine hydrolase n=1 Tax=Hymenobacter sp. J193 TaxID=2898429 RepID=UPI0021511B5D|nr:class A beta-lactamase-related serine hydrolase [Hymenobacter sp. J193]MCR5887534.1 class A beta-lactamase-related serine hydrolase [Hymenobacter sp. J193]
MTTTLRIVWLSCGLLPGWVLAAGAEKKPRLTVAPLPTALTNSPLLDSLLRSNPRLRPVAEQAEQYELQIIYTQINRDVQGKPHFVQHNYRLNARQYFNPASLVKLPVAALALEKLNQLNKPGLTRRTPMATGTAYRCQTPAPYVPAADSDRVNTVGNYIKRMLLVSDNVAYNRLYEFLGQRPLNERLAALGYPEARITRRFAPCDTAANRHTNPITFLDAISDAVVYQQPAAFNSQPFTFPLGKVRKGKGYYVGGKFIQQPYDFTTANYLPLQNVHDLLQAVLFPEEALPTARLQLTPDDYAFLRYYLRSTPHGSGFSLYKSPRYFDAFKKYLVYGRQPAQPAQSDLRIYNIVGMSHGYLADVAYITNATRQTEFLLSAVLYVNKDDILNDGTYEYESIGLPFLAELGRAIQKYEEKRPYLFRLQAAQFFLKEDVR